MRNARHQRHAPDELALQVADLRYTLSRDIPSIKRHVRIQTGYGSVEFYGTQARKIAALCEELLRSRLQRIERQSGESQR